MRPTFSFAAAVALALSWSTTSAFQIASVASRTTSTRLFVDPIGVVQAAADVATSVDAVGMVASDPTAVAEAATAAASQDGGWWATYLSLFSSALTFVHSTIDPPLQSAGITQTWGISIAIFTASIRSLLIPLSVEQTKSAEYMKALKPYMEDIKEKFKDNTDAQNRAIGKLYEDANQNPLAGCLLSLAQLPIFLGLYRGVRNLAADGKLDERFLWIPSLEGPVSAPDYRGLDWLTSNWHAAAPGSLFPLEPSLGWETTLSFLIMPVVLVLGQSLTMSVLSPPMDDNANMSDEEKGTMENTQRVLKFLPLLIGFFSLQVPAGLTIYWFTSNFFSLAQSLAVKSYYAANPPEIELPEYWDALEDVANMSPEEQREAAKAGLRVGPSFAEMLDEAKFHIVVERGPLRTSSVEANVELPSEMMAWVGQEEASMKPTPNATVAAA